MAKRLPLERLEGLKLVFAAAAVVLGLRYLDLHVIRHDAFKEAAELNRTHTIVQEAPRGRIFDRGGRVLAENRPSFSLVFLPGKIEDREYLKTLAQDFAPELGVKREEFYDDLRKAFRRKIPMRLAENLNQRTMFRLSELQPLYPGVNLISEARRYYPYGAFAGHLLGYMGLIDDRTWNRLKARGYRFDSRVGITGVEKIWEDVLRGRNGGVQLEVDSRGRFKRILREIPWNIGGDVHLTIDAELQRTAEEALAASTSGRGAVVVLDPADGSVLVLASVPTFDPNLFMVPRDKEVEQSIRSLPEFNLAIQGTYPPGSVFKIITSLAGLDNGTIDPEHDERIRCVGKYQLGNRVFKCWEKEGHGKMDFYGGLANSCDVYYYVKGQEITPERIEDYEKRFMLGELTQVRLKGEKRGQRFGPEQRKQNGGYWPGGDTLNLAIGQGELLVTPMQMANMVAAVANGGTIYKPNFIERVVDARGRQRYAREKEVLARVRAKDSSWNALRRGLETVVEDATGRRAAVSWLKIGGKTGTAQNPHGEDHAWFVAYGGRPEPGSRKLAMAILVQNAGGGGANAAPIARKLFVAAFPKPKDPPAEAAP